MTRASCQAVLFSPTGATNQSPAPRVQDRSFDGICSSQAISGTPLPILSSEYFLPLREFFYLSLVGVPWFFLSLRSLYSHGVFSTPPCTPLFLNVLLRLRVRFFPACFFHLHFCWYHLPPSNTYWLGLFFLLMLSLTSIRILIWSLIELTSMLLLLCDNHCLWTLYVYRHTNDSQPHYRSMTSHHAKEVK